MNWRSSAGETSPARAERRALPALRLSSAPVPRLLIPLAPWLPPITNMVGRLGSRPSAARQTAGSRGLNCGRTGVPVVTTLLECSLDAACGKPTKHSSTKRESQRLALPGMVFDSCRKIRAPNFFAAKIGGALVNPPMASAASGLRAENALRAASHDFTKLRAKEK